MVVQTEEVNRKKQECHPWQQRRRTATTCLPNIMILEHTRRNPRTNLPSPKDTTNLFNQGLYDLSCRKLFLYCLEIWEGELWVSPCILFLLWQLQGCLSFVQRIHHARNSIQCKESRYQRVLFHFQNLGISNVVPKLQTSLHNSYQSKGARFRLCGRYQDSGRTRAFFRIISINWHGHDEHERPR